MHDIVGHYNRFDVFDLKINRRPLAPLGWAEGERQDKPQEKRGMEQQPEPWSSLPAASE